MANTGTLLAGIILFIIAFLGYIYPVTDFGYSIPQVNNICDSGAGQLAQFYGGQDLRKICQEYKYLTYGIYGFGLIGIILIIVGAIVPSNSKSKETTLTCPYCNYVAYSETELLKHKTEKHLEKSPFKCGHCDFIGITEEVLWNHYNEKHPKEKKW